jgi:hypothetical protein
MKLAIWLIIGFIILLVLIFGCSNITEKFVTSATGFYKIKVIGNKIPKNYMLKIINQANTGQPSFSFSNQTSTNNEFTLGRDYQIPFKGGMAMPFRLEVVDTSNSKIVGKRDIQSKSFKPILYNVTVNSAPSSGPTLSYSLDGGGSGNSDYSINYLTTYPKLYAFIAYWGSTNSYTNSNCNCIIDTTNGNCDYSLDKLVPIGCNTSYAITSVSEVANNCTGNGPAWTNCQMDLQLIASDGNPQTWSSTDLLLYTFLVQSGVYTSIQSFMYNGNSSLIPADEIVTDRSRPMVSLYVCPSCNSSTVNCIESCSKLNPDTLFNSGNCLQNYTGFGNINCPFEFTSGSFPLVFETVNADAIHTVRVNRWFGNLTDSNNSFGSRITNVQTKLKDTGEKLYFINVQLLNSDNCPQTSLSNNDTVSIYAIFSNENGSTGISLTYNYSSSPGTSNTFSWNWCSTNPCPYNTPTNLNSF